MQAEDVNRRMMGCHVGPAAAGVTDKDQVNPHVCAQSCPTLCDSKDGSPPASSVHGIFQARTLEWVAIPFGGSS